MPRAPRLPVVLALALAAGGAAVALPPAPPAPPLLRFVLDLAPADDPFPIRRWRVPAGPAADPPGGLEPGPLVRLPRAEFEARARAAGRAARARPSARPADATYSATLDAGGELTGTAELHLLCGPVPGFAPLDPLRLAVRAAAWADGGAAVLAVPPGAAAPAVLVERAGPRVLKLDWSLAGTAEPGERRFELRVPPCPTSLLELVLPAEQVPAAPADVLLTGPLPAPGKPAHRLWRLRFGGRARVEFAVRAPGTGGAAARATLAARYDLAAGQLAAAFEYDLRPARGSAAEWTFLADPGLRITDVVANNRAAWVVEPPATPGGPRRVRVALRQPGPGGKVLVSAVAPFPDPARGPDAPLPVVRPLGAVLDDERWDVRLAPGLKVGAWAPGDYRLTDALAPGGDLPRALALVGTLAGPGPDAPFRRPPVVRADPHGAEFVTHERLEWALAPGRASLVARLDVRVRRGPLFRLAVRPPPGFVPDRAAPAADDRIAHAEPGPDGELVLEFARPLLSGQRAELELEFHGPGARPGAAVPFPALAVPGAAERAGWLSAAAGPEWALAPAAGPGATPGGLWGWLTADPPRDARALFLYRGRAPAGAVVLTAARAAVRADAVVRAEPAAGGWTGATRFELAVSGGAVPGVLAFVPGPAGPREWKLTGPANAVAAAAPVPVPGGTLWAVRFARPLAGAAALDTVAPAPGPAVPVPRVLGATGDARGAPAGPGRAAVRVTGDRAEPVPEGAPPAVAVTDTYLVTAVRAPGAAVAAFGGTARAGRGGAVAVGLPPGATATGACVGGKWLHPAALAAGGAALAVPVPAGAAVRFEVRYALPEPRGWPTRAFDSPAPDVPGAPEPKRWWAFAPGTLPGWPARPWEATADAPPLLGGPLLGEPPALVTRSDDETVRAGSTRTAAALAAVLAALVLGAALVPVRRPARAAAALAGAVAVALAAVELGPPWWARAGWPPLLAATGALAAVLAATTARAARAARAAVPAGAALALLGGPGPAPARPDAPAAVLVVPAGGGEEVLAPQPLLDRLDALARPGPLPAVVVSAEYDARAEGDTARVTARFAVRAFAPGDSAVSLPLGDARLERATVGGRPAFPAQVPGQPGTYAVPVGGPGPHEVEVRFAVAVAASGPDREVRFAGPEVPRARLVAALPAGARQPAAVGRAGAQAVTAAGDRTRVEADLGATRAVLLRWREGAGGAAVLRVREACVWDAAESGADLTAAYLVRVDRGAAAGVRFEVPAELEVLRVAARATDAPGGPVPLRDWALGAEQGGFRPLRVDFQSPVTGRFAVVFECAPRTPLGRQPVLRFPRVAPDPGGEVDSVYGFRTKGLVAEAVALGGLIDFAPEALREFAAVPDLRLGAGPPVRAFKPAPGAGGELRPVLRAAEPPAARAATAWHLGPGRADGHGTVTWAAKEPLALVEFAVPGARVLEVRGAEVGAWNPSGDRVQVWLKGAAREGAFEWTATAVPPAGGPFEVPVPVAFGARPSGEEVRVRPADGFAVRPERARGWQVLPAPAGEVRARADAPGAPPPRVQLAPP